MKLHVYFFAITPLISKSNTGIYYYTQVNQNTCCMQPLCGAPLCMYSCARVQRSESLAVSGGGGGGGYFVSPAECVKPFCYAACSMPPTGTRLSVT